MLHLRIGVTDFTSFPDQIDGVQAVKLLDAKWPQGSTLSLDVVVTGFDRSDTKAAVQSLETAGLTVPGLSAPVTVTPSRDGAVAFVSFTMAGTQNDPASQAIVRQMRTTIVPATFAALAGVHAYVTGDAADALDVSQIYLDAIPLVFAFVLGLSFLLLLVVFHSLVIPIKAIALNLLSTAAAFGIMVAVFQDGIVGHAFGLAGSSVIESWVPIFVFAILFGLSMDYHVFILTRVKEARDRGLDSRAAVAKGIAITSGTITSAATIMVLVFAAFITIPFAFIQELGLGLAVAVLLDATVVRSVLLPATMTLLGDWNWWLPSFLRWLPRVTIEGEPEADVHPEPLGAPSA
jgi:RND superfamily putative drug exporter